MPPTPPAFCDSEVHGGLLKELTTSIDSFHQAGDTTNLVWVFVHLMVLFDRAGRPEIAATFCGTTAEAVHYAHHYIDNTRQQQT